MKTYKVVLSITDHDDIGLQEIKNIIENTKYPNHCIDPCVVDISSKYIKWSNDHPLNITSKMKETFWQLFGGSGYIDPNFVNKLLTLKDDEMIEYLYDRVDDALTVHDFKSVDDMLLDVKPELFSTVMLIGFLTITNRAKQKLSNRHELYRKIYDELTRRHPDRVDRLMQGF